MGPRLVNDMEKRNGGAMYGVNRGGSRNLGRGGTGRGWVWEGDVPPPARSAEALSNIGILTHMSLRSLVPRPTSQLRMNDITA